MDAMGRLRFLLVCLAALLLLSPAAAFAQHLGGKRLILKDGSYQMVEKYQVVGDRVRYLSTEREDWEEVPYSMVNWPATNQWNKEHALNANGQPVTNVPPVNEGEKEAEAIDKETAAERLRLREQTPTVAPGLQLPNEDGVFVLDNFQNIPEIVQLNQSSGDLNQGGDHNVFRAAIASFRGAREPVRLLGQAAKVRVHVDDPAIYVSLTQPPGAETDTEDAFVVNVKDNGKPSKNDYSSPASRYAIVRVEVVPGERVIGAISLRRLNGKVIQSEDIVPTTAQILPGGYWMKLTPKDPLTIGEYALMEILAPGEINLDVWDFGVNPSAPENAHPITPIKVGNGDQGQGSGIRD